MGGAAALLLDRFLEATPAVWTSNAAKWHRCMNAAAELARRCANNRVACAGRQWQEFLALVGREPPRVPVLTDADVDRVAQRVVEMLDARDMDDHR